MVANLAGLKSLWRHWGRRIYKELRANLSYSHSHRMDSRRAFSGKRLANCLCCRTAEPRPQVEAARVPMPNLRIHNRGRFRAVLALCVDGFVPRSASIVSLTVV